MDGVRKMCICIFYIQAKYLVRKGVLNSIVMFQCD